MIVRARALSALAVVVAVAGCNALIGLHDGESANGGGGDGGASLASSGTKAVASSAGGEATTAVTSSSSFVQSSTSDAASTVASTGAGGACAVGACLEAPPNWKIVLVASAAQDNPPECGKMTTIFAGGTSAAQVMSSCGCSCAPACTPPVVDLYSSDCTTMTSQIPEDWGDCVPVIAGAGVEIGASSPLSACTALASSQFDAPKFSDAWVACAADLGPPCGGGGACVAPPNDFKACITTPSIATCPSDMPNQTIVYTSLEDSRACTPCSCGPISSGKPTCDAQIQLYDDGACGTADGFAPPGACVSSGEESIRLEVDGPMCQASASSLSGSITPSGANTICCQ